MKDVKALPLCYIDIMHRYYEELHGSTGTFKTLQIYWMCNALKKYGGGTAMQRKKYSQTDGSISQQI